MNCKQQICDTLLTILDIESDLKMSLFLGFFKDEIESRQSEDADSEVNQSGFGGHAVSSKVHPVEGMRKNGDDDNRRLLASVHRQPSTPFDDLDAIEWLEKVLMGEQLFDSYPQTKYVCILIDMIAYNHVSLNNKAFELLISFFNQRYQLIELLKQIQLLEQPESIKVLKTINLMTGELKTFSEAFHQWLDDDEGMLNVMDFSTRLISCKEKIDYMCDILVTRQNARGKKLLTSIMRRQGSVFDSINSPNSKVNQTFVFGANGNIQKSTDQGTEELIPNTENQRLLKNLNMQEIVMQTLK